MKYLYKILRLFFCPHKWREIESKRMIRTVKTINGYDQRNYVFIYECKYCGKMEQKRIGE